MNFFTIYYIFLFECLCNGLLNYVSFKHIKWAKIYFKFYFNVLPFLGRIIRAHACILTMCDGAVIEGPPISVIVSIR